MHQLWLIVFAAVQILYFLGMAVTYWFFTRHVDVVPLDSPAAKELPPVVLLYPVLNEIEGTMRTAFTGMAQVDYPADRFRVVAIPNVGDEQSIAALRNLESEFPFLEIMPVPPTSDRSWDLVWDAWDANERAYWWHTGKRRGEQALPPKKTRQMVWAMYQLAPTSYDALLSYIDADSVVPRDYFKLAAAGMQDFDVIQNTNINGNLMKSWASSFFALDHIQWDATLYRHMTARGKHPFYVLGKGLFFRFSDLLAVGGFHPWLTIEDPEIGMRLWTNGAKLGVVESPLIEEVPATFGQGVTQRKRWVAGFFQTLASPLVLMGMSFRQRMRARLNLVPTLSLLSNIIGWPIGVWALVSLLTTDDPGGLFPTWLTILSVVNVVGALGLLATAMVRAYVKTEAVLPERKDRLLYLLRVNPVFLLFYWLWWCVPLVIGFTMFLRDTGLAWERTVKIDANAELIQSRSLQSSSGSTSGATATAAQRESDKA